MRGGLGPFVLSLLHRAFHSHRINGARAAQEAHDERDFEAFDVVEHQRRPALLWDLPERLARDRRDLPILIDFSRDVRQEAGALQPLQVLAQILIWHGPSRTPAWGCPQGFAGWP